MGEQDAAHRTQQESLRQELRQIAQRLTDDKIDRSTLGELFIMRGQRKRVEQCSRLPIKCVYWVTLRSARPA
jgi:hypothetical protein